MRDKTVRWLWQMSGREKGYIAALAAVQALLGAYGVIYALLLRNIVNSAVAHDSRTFWHFVALILLLVAGQEVLQAVMRWLNELSKSTLENVFKNRLTDNILRRDFASVSYGTLTAVMQMIGQIQAPFANISGYLPRWYAMTASAERLMEIEQFPDDGAETALSFDKVSDYYVKQLQAITLRDACFNYAGADMPVVLKNLNLVIRSNPHTKDARVIFQGQI